MRCFNKTHLDQPKIITQIINTSIICLSSKSMHLMQQICPVVDLLNKSVKLSTSLHVGMATV